MIALQATSATTCAAIGSPARGLRLSTSASLSGRISLLFPEAQADVKTDGTPLIGLSMN